MITAIIGNSFFSTIHSCPLLSDHFHTHLTVIVVIAFIVIVIITNTMECSITYHYEWKSNLWLRSLINEWIIRCDEIDSTLWWTRFETESGSGSGFCSTFSIVQKWIGQIGQHPINKYRINNRFLTNVNYFIWWIIIFVNQ